MKAFDIQWDLDEEDAGIQLPSEVDIPEEMIDEDEISDYLSDLTGFCHKGFRLTSDEEKDAEDEP